MRCACGRPGCEACPVPRPGMTWPCRVRNPALRRYLVIVVLGNLAWEFAQVPLYTFWQTDAPGEVAWEAIHCSAGDVLIVAAALAASLLLFGGTSWPRLHVRRVAATCIGIGLCITVLIERLATAWRPWTYPVRCRSCLGWAWAWLRLHGGSSSRLSPCGRWLRPCGSFQGRLGQFAAS